MLTSVRRAAVNRLRLHPRAYRLAKRVRGRRPQQAADLFVGHYDDWREKRIAAIIDHYGANFFAGKTVLEVGCGYGDIGHAIAELGADVTYSDARPEHLDVLKGRWPDAKTQVVDLDAGWPFARHDIVLHIGVLYHLRTPELALRDAIRGGKWLVLETEVVDSSDATRTINVGEDGLDQAFNGVGSRPSTAYVERVLHDAGCTFTRVTDDRCNAGVHVYDWPDRNTGEWRDGLRRFWFVECPS